MLEESYNTYKKQGVLFLGAFYQSKRHEIREYIEQYPQSFPVGKATTLARSLRVKSVPEIIFISRGSRITMRYNNKISKEQLTAGIEEILQ